MKHLFTLFLLSLTVSLNAQITGHWTRFLSIPPEAGTSGYCHHMTAAADGDVYITGGSWFDSVFVQRYNPYGNLVWANVYYGPGGAPLGRSAAIPSIATLSDGDAVMAVNDLSPAMHQRLMRIDTSGTMLWSLDLTPATTYGETGEGLYVDASDNIIFHVSLHRVVKVSPAGVIVWDHVTSDQDRMTPNVTLGDAGDAFVVRQDLDTLPSGETYFVSVLDKINAAGVTTSVALPDSHGVGFVTFSNGYLCVESNAYDGGSTEWHLLKIYREDLTLVASDTLSATHDLVRNMIAGPDASFYLLCDYPPAVVRIDTLSNILGSSPITPPSLDMAWWAKFLTDADGDVYVQSNMYGVSSPYDREAVVCFDKATGALLSHTIIAENLPFSYGENHYATNGDAFYFMLEDYDNFYLFSKLCTSGCPTNLFGDVWKDVDADCVEDPLEFPWPGLVVETTPHHFVASVDSFGDYSMSLWPDTHTVMVNLPPYRYVSCTAAPYTEIVTGSSSHPDIDFGVTNYPGITDMVMIGADGISRPGFDVNVWGHARNIGTVSATGRVRLDYDPLFTLVGAVPVPDSVLPGALVWNYTTLAEWDHMNPVVALNLAPTVPIGTPYTHVWHAYTSVADTTPYDNHDTINDIVSGAYDPNAKYFQDQGPTVDLGTETDKELWFEIFFQNTGTDTAFTVLVRDTLEADLDWGHMTTWITSHPATFSLTGSGYAEWRFDNILLPDSNTNEPASHGYILFSVPVRTPTTIGQTITNRASIYFDYNVPVLTNTALGTFVGLTSTTPAAQEVWQVYPNPFSSELRVRGSTDAAYQLCDLSGRILLQGQLGLAGDEAAVSTQSLPRGVYLLRLQGESGAVSTFKVVKSE